jgi:predicted phosphoribosyltransferase
MRFSGRKEAGGLVAEMLRSYRGMSDTVVVALPRGGVPVADAIAEKLKLPLNIFFVKKIPSPYNEEVGMGAVSENGLVQVNSNAAAAMEVSDEYIRLRVREKLEHMRQKRKLYGLHESDFSGKTVIVTDDGIATGSSMFLAVEALKKTGASKVVVAVPVAPAELIPEAVLYQVFLRSIPFTRSNNSSR